MAQIKEVDHTPNFSSAFSEMRLKEIKIELMPFLLTFDSNFVTLLYFVSTRLAAANVIWLKRQTPCLFFRHDPSSVADDV